MPFGRAMHEPLRRCYDAMAEPRIVIAVGASAICVDAVCSCPFVAAFDGALDGVDDVDADEDVP